MCRGEDEGERDLLECVAVLVDQSLLQHREGADGELRVGMLETIREYGLECLTAEERAHLADRHLAYYMGLAERGGAEFAGVNQRRWLERIEQEQGNVRAALAWAVQAGSVELGLRLGGALWWFWGIRCLWDEGWEQLGRLLAMPGAGERTAPRAKALAGAGLMCFWLGRLDLLRALSDESLSIGRECGDRMSVAMALRNLGHWALRRDPKSAHTFLEDGLVAWRELGNQWGIALSLGLLSRLAAQEGDWQTSRSLQEEALAIRRVLGDPQGIAWSFQRLGVVAAGEGDVEQARRLLLDGLAIFQELCDTMGQAECFQALAEIAQQQGNHARAEAALEDLGGLYRERGNRNSLAWTLWELGRVARVQGRQARASVRFKEALALSREVNVPWLTAAAVAGLGMVALDQCEYSRARALFFESLHLARELGNDRGVANGLVGLAGVAAATGRPWRTALLLGAAKALLPAGAATGQLPRTAQLLGASKTLLLPAGDGVPPVFESVDYESAAAAARAALGEEGFARAWAEGQALALDQAVALALAEPSPDQQA
jgi:tetratricopeptide (TPR) repeat protein